MRRRNLIPLALLAVLSVLTVLFAALAASSSPDSSSLVVQNATGETFGYPDGASSFSMHLIETAAASTGSGTTYTQVRLVNFSGPDRMAVYATGAPLKLLAVLDQPAIECARRAYTAMAGGATPWAFSGTSTKAGSAGSIYRRTENQRRPRDGLRAGDRPVGLPGQPAHRHCGPAADHRGRQPRRTRRRGRDPSAAEDQRHARRLALIGAQVMACPEARRSRSKRAIRSR
jgi:hypothetical protein